MLKRKAYDRLLTWKARNGSTSMLVEGARRVGKTTLVQEFGRREYGSMLFIDFFQAPDQVKEYFEQYRDNIPTLLAYLSSYYDVELHERSSLVVFDEVQCFPLARGLLKYLVADGRYDYVETGSLLSIRQNVQGIVLPSEEERIRLEPLDFEEFLWALNERSTANLIRLHHADLSRPPDSLHRKAWRLWREYLLVGGMPEPVNSYARDRRFAPADAEKRKILDLYRNDVARFAHGYEYKVTSIFDQIPGQLSKHEKKFTYASLSKDARRRDYEEAFFWLADARIANPCYAATDPSVGLALSSDHAKLKLYMADTGLLVTHAFSEAGPMDERAYRSLLNDSIGVNEGMLVENAVAQTLVASGNDLYFYTQSGRREGEQRMEIDFLVTRSYKNAALKPRVCPIEVKSPGRYGTTSLDRFKTRFAKRVGTQYVLHPKPLRIEDERIYLPLYMAHLV